MKWPRFGEVVRTHRFVVAFDQPHDVLSLELERSLVRRGMKIFGTGPLQALDGEMFWELPSILHVGDAFVLVLDAERFEDPQILALVAAMRWFAQRASAALELVVVGDTEPQPEHEGIHFVAPLFDDPKPVREVAKKIHTRAKGTPRRPRTSPTADEHAVVDALIRSESRVDSTFRFDMLEATTHLSRERIEVALRSAVRRGWLSVTDLSPIREGARPDVFVRLTELGFAARGDQAMPKGKRFGRTLADQRHGLHTQELKLLMRDRWYE